MEGSEWMEDTEHYGFSLRSLLSGGSSSPFDSVLTWEVAVLFAFFVVITVVWEFSLAFFSFVTLHFSGRKALWITRIKDEVLALGVITLVLTMVQESLASICIKGEQTQHVAADDHECEDGYRLLFTTHMIHETHYLLFSVAVVHIVYGCASLYLCLFRMRWWRKWERSARDGTSLDVGGDALFANLGRNKPVHVIRMFISIAWSTVTQPVYTLMRLLFRLRIDSAVSDKDKLPRQFNFLHLVEQAMEFEFSKAAEHAWVLSAVMAVFLAIPQSAHGIYWLAGLSWITTMALSAKLQSIVVQLGATAYFDFHDDIEQYMREQVSGFKKFKRTFSSATGALRSPSSPGRAVAEAREGHASVYAKSPSQDLEKGDPSQGKINNKRSVKFNQVAPEAPGPEPVKLPTYDEYKDRVRVKLTGKTDGPPDECNGLFWFRSPTLMLWVFQLCYLENSMSLTLLIYALYRDSASLFEQEGVGPIVGLFVVDICLMIYSAWTVLPVYALAHTVATDHPKRLIHEIKMQKLVEEEDHEHGVGGSLLKLCFGGGHHEVVDIARGRSFIALLAGQAGVMTAGHHHSDITARKSNPFYRGFALVWYEHMQQWTEMGRPSLSPSRHGAPPPPVYEADTGFQFPARDDRPLTWAVSGDLTRYKEAFNAIDRNANGTISSRELAQVMRALGTRATIEELEDMVREVDKDGSDAIDFDEFVLFMIFKFFDHDNDGYLTCADIEAAFTALGILKSPATASEAGQSPQQQSEVARRLHKEAAEAAELLIDYVEKDQDDRRGRIELAEFIHFFSCVQFIQRDEELEMQSFSLAVAAGSPTAARAPAAAATAPAPGPGPMLPGRVQRREERSGNSAQQEQAGAQQQQPQQQPPPLQQQQQNPGSPKAQQQEPPPQPPPPQQQQEQPEARRSTGGGPAQPSGGTG